MFIEGPVAYANTLGLCSAVLCVSFIALLVVRILNSGDQKTWWPRKLQAWCNKFRFDAEFLSGRSVQFIDALHKEQGKTFGLGGSQVFSNTVEGFQAIYGTSSRYGGVFPKSKWYMRMSAKPDIFTDRDVGRHCQARRLFSPAFNLRSVTDCEPTIKHHCDRFMSVIRESASQGIEMGHLIHCYMADVMFDINVGKQMNCLNTGKPVGWTAQLSRVFYWATVKDQLDGSGIPTALKWLLHPFFVKGARKFKSEAASTIQSQLYDANDRKGIMVKVLERDDATAWNEDRLLPHIRAVLLASVHSTTTALTATLQFILKNPNTHIQLIKELRAEFGTADQVSLSVLPSLPYLNATIDESLRLFPPIPLLGPRVSPGYMVDDHYVDPGHELFTSLYSLHRNPEYFPEPESFMPERWLDPATVAKQRAAFHPFSTGSRSCIGKHLALQVLRLSLARLLLEFDGQCTGDITNWTGESRCYAVWEVPDLWVKFTPLPKEDEVLMSDGSSSSG